jgi:very-short-patch-repair endonuclease
VSASEDALAWQLRVVNGIAQPEREHRFHPERRWRLDFAWPDVRVAVEVDGGAWVGGRHVSGQGFEEDCHKLSMAAALGWRVLRVTPRMVNDGLALTLILAALEVRP